MYPAYCFCICIVYANEKEMLSLFEGMRPLLYSEKEVKQKGIGWHRVGHHISYSRNIFNLQCPLLPRDMALFMLEWQMVNITSYFLHLNIL